MKYQSFLSVAACVFSVFLLSHYLLPNTILARFSPLHFSVVFTIGTSSLLFNSILCLATVATLFIYYRSTLKVEEAGSLLRTITIYLGVVMIVVITGRHDVQVTHNCFLLLLTITVGLICARLCGSASRSLIVISVVAIIQGCYALIYQHSGHNIMISGDVLRAGGTFGHPNGLYTIMMICLPLTIVSAFQTNFSPARLTLFIGASIIFASLIVTWHRGGILGTCVALIYLIYHLTRRRLITVITAICMIFLFAGAMHNRSTGIVNEASSSRSTQSRFVLWKRSVTIFKHHWITGVGIGALEIPIRARSIHGFDDIIVLEPKNLFLHFLDEMGIGGGVLFVMFILSIANILRRSSTMTACGIGAAWISLLVCGLTDTPIGQAERYYGNVLFGFLVGSTLLLDKSIKIPIP